MDDALDIPRIAALLADPARAMMLWTLMDGTLRPAGELAFAAKVSPQSASAHLAKLVDGGLLLSRPEGRHRYFGIASPEAAHLIESLASLAACVRPRTPPPPPLALSMPSGFLKARTCYDHLAGELAVRILAAMCEAGWLGGPEREFEVMPLGQRELAALGIDVEGLRAGRRAVARGCVDLTQRRPHLAGALGTALLALYVRERWIQRSQGSRLVRITPKGQAAFRRLWGVEI